MLTIENTSVHGFEDAIRGMRNPLNSWSKSDSRFEDDVGYHDICKESYSDENTFDHYDDYPRPTLIGAADKDLMKRLASAGKDHAKYRRMIVVYADLIAPLYWWKEYDTYKVGTVANSCSTMHKIQAKEFMLDDFSHEHLFGSSNGLFSDLNTADSEEELIGRGAYDVHQEWNEDAEDWWEGKFALDTLCETIVALNEYRKLYLETNDKRYWWQMIQLLPSSYNQKRTVMLNYEVLANIYPARKAHKLDEWHTFCDWIESLPESWIITGEEKDA